MRYATQKQILFIEAICEELHIDIPNLDRLDIRSASAFISLHVGEFKNHKTKKKIRNVQKINKNRHVTNYKIPKELQIGISTEQSVENIKKSLTKYFGYDITKETKS